MARFPLSLPPGCYRNGTLYQSKGRWYDANLVRFFQGSKRPMGGWRAHSTSTVTGKPRACVAWKDNSANSWCGVGTESHLYAMNRAGTVSDITPAGFTSGRVDATTGSGYGTGNYGDSTYGTPRADTTNILDASTWSLDAFGQYLNGVMTEDGKLYEWRLNTSVVAAAISGAPTADACFVTSEGMLVALGAAGIKRRVQWSDQELNTVWTASATNQAGDVDLQTSGRLMLGRRARGTHLLLTDVDAWTMTYRGDSFVYGFEKIGSGCGAVSRNCMAVIDARAVWMSRNSFWIYNGYVQSLACDLSDYVFSDINLLQASKFHCVQNSAFNEIKFYYCSASSSEINRYVIWNHVENHWTSGAVGRLSGVDAGVFSYPLECGSDGYVYDHEVGNSYTGAAAPYLESGPIEMGVGPGYTGPTAYGANGDNVIYATMLYPDDATVGDVSATFYTKFEADGPETTHGPYTLTQKTSVRFGGRQLRVRFTGVNSVDWRVGTPRLELVQGGLR